MPVGVRMAPIDPEAVELFPALAELPVEGRWALATPSASKAHKGIANTTPNLVEWQRSRVIWYSLHEARFRHVIVMVSLYFCLVNQKHRPLEKNRFLDRRLQRSL
jgi:hypothetical protein